MAGSMANAAAANANQPVVKPKQPVIPPVVKTQPSMATQAVQQPEQPTQPEQPEQPAQVDSVNTKDYSVANNLTNLLDAGGSYLTQARQQGEAAARRRGLGNTSIAGQASVGEAIRAASPIAAQDAAAQQERWKLTNEVSANLQGEYTRTVSGLISDYQTNVAAIEASPNIKTAEKQKMIENLTSQRDANLDLSRRIYSNMPTWNTNWSLLPDMPSAPGITTA